MIQVGKIAIFGIPGTITLTGTGMLDTDEMLKQSASVTSSATPVDLENDEGNILRRAYTKRQRSVDLMFIPYDPDTPGALATLAAKVKLPAEGSAVTLADFSSPDLNGTWNFESGSITPQKGNYLQFSIRLSRVGLSGGVPVSL
jgi:hypothetical protein